MCQRPLLPLYGVELELAACFFKAEMKKKWGKEKEEEMKERKRELETER